MSTTDDGTRLIMIDDAIKDFDRYLITGKNASEMTRQCYTRHARAFLNTVAQSAAAVDLEQLSGPQVRSYVTDLGERYAPQSLKLKATALRIFLRFAWMSGQMSSDLTGAVGPVITHRSGKIPKALHPDELVRLLAAPDRHTLGGTRDYALLVLMSRLGFRAGEVGGLRLDDIDWAHAKVRVRVKGGNVLELPIPGDVGSALVEYLQRRPTPTPHREVFLTNYGAPVPMTRGAVTQVVERNARTAGLGMVHAHRLRHSAARAVLVGGGTFEEVGELLGHATRQVTMAYSSFDLASMRPLARPWPVRGQ
jgi:site-specific recombinase XerD